MTLSSLFLLLSAPALQLPGGAWERTWSVEGTLPAQYLGASLAAAGDVDGDGVGDLLVGERQGPTGGTPPGKVRVLSGSDGALLWLGHGDPNSLDPGRVVAGLGDVDGDGVPDVAMGNAAASAAGLSLAGRVEVRSVAKDLVIWQLSGTRAFELLGNALARIPDVDGDGADDLAVGVSGGGGHGSLLMLSGSDGSVLWQVPGTSAFPEGRVLAAAGDFDGDGVADVLSGNGEADVPGLGSAGMVLVRSGRDGGVLSRFPGPWTGSTFGSAVAAVGDLEGDGLPELLVGGFADDPAGLANAGRVWMISGATGAPLWSLAGTTNQHQHLGAAVAPAGDADGDGWPEVLVAAPDEWGHSGNSCGVVRLLRARDGALVQRFEGAVSAARLGSSLTTLGDLDRDGTAEFALAADLSPTALQTEGVVELQSFDPFLIPSADQLSLSGGSAVSLELHFPAAEAGAAYAVLLSLAGPGITTVVGIEVPLKQDRLFDQVVAGAGPPWLQGGRGILSSSAAALATLRGDPRGTALLGRHLRLAAISLDPVLHIGRRSSAARSLLITP